VVAVAVDGVLLGLLQLLLLSLVWMVFYADNVEWGGGAP